MGWREGNGHPQSPWLTCQLLLHCLQEAGLSRRSRGSWGAGGSVTCPRYWAGFASFEFQSLGLFPPWKRPLGSEVLFQQMIRHECAAETGLCFLWGYADTPTRHLLYQDCPPSPFAQTLLTFKGQSGAIRPSSRKPSLTTQSPQDLLSTSQAYPAALPHTWH
jgi:hypothetical protein